MLEGKTIFILSLMKFDGLPSTNFTIAKYLAKNNDVYYIEHPYTLKDYYKAGRKSAAFQTRKVGWSSSTGILPQKIENINIVVNKPVLPVNFLPTGIVYEKLNRLNERMIANNIKRIIKKKNIKEYIFINFYDYNFPWVGKYLNALLNIYYCVDPVPDYDRKHGLQNEKKLINVSDVIICTSKALYDEKKLLNPNTYFVPNASDLVTDVEISTLQDSERLKDIPKPIVGYIGAIERRIDYSLLQQVIKTLPGINFVFVGPVHKEYIPEWFFSQSNIFFLPPVTYKEVAEIINGFNVCIIPFKTDEISKTIFPLKLFEYLGMGKPVVITNFNPDLKEFTGDLVYYTAGAAAFEQQVKQALSQSDEKKESERREIAKQNTWPARIIKLSKIFEKHLQNN